LLEIQVIFRQTTLSTLIQ